jgi:CBS domain-containing protein
VHDYVDGKADWLAAGLPTEGTNAERPSARDVARSDVPTCRPGEPFADVRDRVRAAGWDACVVVNEERIVLGLLRRAQLEKGGQEDSAEQVMRLGPSTFRPNVPIAELAEYMTEHDLESSPITSSDGRLIGLLRRDDAVRVTLEEHRHLHEAEDR